MIVSTCSYLIIHSLSIQVITFLQHLHQNLINSVETIYYTICISRLSAIIYCSVINYYFMFLELFQEASHEYILTTYYKRTQHIIVIIPTPAFTKLLIIFHALVGIQRSDNRVNSHFLNSLNKRIKIITVETRIKTSHTIYIPLKSMIFNLSCIAKFRLKLVISTKFINCCDCCDKFHGACRAQKLLFVETEYCAVCVKIIHNHSQL